MITRSKKKRTRENLNRLPREVEATLPSWVKCTDPIPREILEEVRSTVLVWMKNVRNYVEETETYILNDEHAPPEVVDDEWALVVERDLCFDPHLRVQFFRHAYYEDTEQNAQHIEDDYAEGVGRFAAYDSDTDSDTETGKRFTGWSRFIRRMILCDVNTFISKDVTNYVEETEITDIVVGSRKESQSEDGTGIEWTRGMLRLAVIFHERLSSEIKDEICSKLASALRALKSRISRICGINELERRVSLAPEAV